MSRETVRAQALRKLNIKKDRRVILSLDGGGIRGIMTLQLLKDMEQVAGAPCHVFCDLVAGTSTGAIIAGLIASGKSACEIETLYQRLVTDVFEERHALASTLINPPAYTKRAYLEALRQELGDATLQETCDFTGVDLMITAKDAVAGEETFFSCFASNDVKQSEYSVYANVLMRAALEATMSAPTYFYPMERFVDGGVTAYNNPTLAAVQEAVSYGPKKPHAKYDRDKLTVLSFGTGCRPRFVSLTDLDDSDTPGALFWLNWLLSETGDDASDMQSYLLRSELMASVDFRRFQVSLDETALTKLPNVDLHPRRKSEPGRLHELTDDQLAKIKLDRVEDFDLMRAVGAAMAEAVVVEAAKRDLPAYGFDLLDSAGKELFVTRRGDVPRIAQQMSCPAWVDDRLRQV